MEFSAKNKPDGGKLISVKVWADGDRIEKAQILGDFFIYPESVVGFIETALIGKAVSDRANMILSIEQVLEQKNGEMVGVTPESIVDTIQMAVKG